MKIFTESDIRSFIKLNKEVIHIIEDAFKQLVINQVVMPPIMRIDVKENNGEVDVKSAYIPNKDFFAIKVSSGFFYNYQLGLPSANGFMMLISTKTGEPKSFLLDNGYLTEIRTAAAGAIAAKHLAKEAVTTVGVIGTGAQARYQMRALKLVRDYKEIRVYGRLESNVQKFKEEMEAALHITVIPASSPEEVVKLSEIVVTTTPSKSPIIKSEWLHPGLHITAMGSDAEDKQELEGAVIAKSDRYVCDSKAQCLRLGELHHAVREGQMNKAYPVIELGEIIAGKSPGRINDHEVTVCDLTGTGVQDTAIALYAYHLLESFETIGMTVDNHKQLTVM
ncbi:cyclodeaminase [Niallia endozanthoxylica]|uniref:Cyclodeaminase n=1 Tax=Niallia endozanthoxylica TaxID=2036016 RepID=A0A5J5HAV8_9BACI|nr:cyclodeaminase [Niallia endozanthoxylica]KAA9017028.1 cyclodeaminase [Niallia endozanthoxylica]